MGSRCYELQLWWDVPASVSVVAHEIKEPEKEMYQSGDNDGVVSPRAVGGMGKVGKVASKKHAKRTSSMTETAVVLENNAAGEVFSVEKVVKGLKGKEKIGEIGMGSTDPNCKKGEARFEQAKMMDWAAKELLEEGEVGRPRLES